MERVIKFFKKVVIAFAGSFFVGGMFVNAVLSSGYVHVSDKKDSPKDENLEKK